jgi:hypothetical protein
VFSELLARTSILYIPRRARSGMHTTSKLCTNTGPRIRSSVATTDHRVHLQDTVEHGLRVRKTQMLTYSGRSGDHECAGRRYDTWESKQEVGT